MAILASILVTTGLALATAAGGGLDATVDGTDPLKPVLTLTNAGEQPCQIVATALGTIAVTSVEQAGIPAAAQPMEMATDDGLQLADRLTTLEPGGSVQLPLRVVPLGGDSYGLVAVSWSETSGVYGALYPITPDVPVAITLAYSVPVEIKEGPAACAPAAATVSAAGQTSQSTPWLLIAGIALAVLLALLVVLLLWTRRRRSAAAAAVVVLGLLLAPLSEREARAAYNVHPNLQEAFDTCMALFRQPGNDPAGILPTLDDPGMNVQIVETNGDETHAGIIDENHGIIFWDPDDTHTYYGSGGSADPCTSLYHEMHHVWQGNQGTYSREPCATSDAGGRTLPKTEVLATHAQNALRRALGLPERDHYGDIPLPADCQPPEPPDDRCTGQNCGDSNGDPHLRTFDGVRYDFMAVGEFIAAKSGVAGFEVQVRQQPPVGSILRLVSLNTAVAMQVDAARIELRMTERKLELLVDGTVQELKPGGPIEVQGRTVVVSWADGSKAYVRPIGPWGIHVAVQPSGVHSGKLEGLFGDFDADPENDVRPRGGDPIEPAFETLYPGFADSWRVEAATSLFTYPPGVGPQTYADRDYPDQRVTVDDLPNRAAAQALCRQHGITDPVVLAGCVLDVALTGLADFAAAAADSQRIEPIRDFGGQRFDVTITEPGGSAEVQFTGKAGQQVFVDVPITTLPSQCGRLEIRGPDGARVGSTGCIINGTGYVNNTTLPVDGTYTIRVRTTSTGTGTARLMLLTIADQHGTIEPDGPAVLAKTDKPGVVSRFMFDGTAGQKVFLDIGESTLPSQCGGITLDGPDGTRVTQSGCIINGRGYIDAVLLPDSGTYTITIDPVDRRVGESRLQLNTAVDQHGTLSVNGPAVQVNISKPGTDAYFTFAGAAGQRIYLDFTEVTLPNQCGGYSLRAPDGSQINGFCVINGRGTFDEDGIVLPESGTFTIELNPGDRKTGIGALRVRT